MKRPANEAHSNKAIGINKEKQSWISLIDLTPLLCLEPCLVFCVFTSSSQKHAPIQSQESKGLDY